MAFYQDMGMEALLVLACYNAAKPCVHYSHGLVVFCLGWGVFVWLGFLFC